MKLLVLYVGIGVTFLTIWGVVMVGGFLFGRESADARATPTSMWANEKSAPSESDLGG